MRQLSLTTNIFSAGFRPTGDAIGTRPDSNQSRPRKDSTHKGSNYGPASSAAVFFFILKREGVRDKGAGEKHRVGERESKTTKLKVRNRGTSND